MARGCSRCERSEGGSAAASASEHPELLLGLRAQRYRVMACHRLGVEPQRSCDWTVATP